MYNSKNKFKTILFCRRRKKKMMYTTVHIFCSVHWKQNLFSNESELTKCVTNIDEHFCFRLNQVTANVTWKNSSTFSSTGCSCWNFKFFIRKPYCSLHKTTASRHLLHTNHCPTSNMFLSTQILLHAIKVNLNIISKYLLTHYF